MHIMLDLETFGTRPGCAIRSIGAVVFDLEGFIGAEFYQNVDLQSCLDAGLKIEAATLAWWDKQSTEARAALADKQATLRDAAGRFHMWFANQSGIYVWSHGANFDEPIWTAAIAAIGGRVPWKFWNVRCTRTAFDLNHFDPRSVTRAGTYHNALDDAAYQARCVQAAVKQGRVA